MLFTYFQFETNFKYRRDGSEKDEEELVKTWEYLGCQNNVTVKRDLTEIEMMATLKNFRRRLSLADPDFMVLVILSHGNRDVKTGNECILDVNMKPVPFKKIKNMFVDGHKCRSMVGKPKFFFIQACRGTERQNPTTTNCRYFIATLLVCGVYIRINDRKIRNYHSKHLTNNKKVFKDKFVNAYRK